MYKVSAPSRFTQNKQCYMHTSLLRSVLFCLVTKSISQISYAEKEKKTM